MNKKKEILKKYTGKGGIIGDTIRQIPNTIKGMGQNLMKGNLVKAVDPAGIVKKGLNWVGGQIAKDNASRAYSGEKVRQEIEDESHGGRYVPEPEKKQVIKSAIQKTGVGTRYPKMAPLKTSMPLKKTPTPKGWDNVTYKNFKRANPTLEPDAEDTKRMLSAK